MLIILTVNIICISQFLIRSITSWQVLSIFEIPLLKENFAESIRQISVVRSEILWQDLSPNS